jgi:AAA+ ATPase superfamily predicted ATPase
MNLIGRTQELDLLKKALNSKRKELCILYGRRRLGKTAILRECLRQSQGLFFSCPVASSGEALRLFQARMAETFHEPLLLNTRFAGWREALCYAIQQCSDRKWPLIFDEFPYLLRSVPGVDSLLQHEWDHAQGAPKIILCGSSLSIMESEVLGSHAPLFGRRTLQIELGPMDFRTVSKFYGKRKFEEQILYYSFFGGIPAYAEHAAELEDPVEALTKLVLEPHGVLYSEPDFLMREELREPVSYFSILHAISAGNTRPNRIAQAAGIPGQSLAKYLDVLRRMRLVNRKTPITEKHQERSSKSIYTIDDPFLRFWFRFVFSERSALELGLAKRIWKEKISKDYDSVLGLLYEDVVRQELRGQWESWLGWEPARIGQYWDANTELDIVAEDLAGGCVAFFECKWSLSADVEKELRILQAKARAIPHFAEYHHEYFIVSRTASKHPRHIRLAF